VALNINQFARLSASPGSLYSYVANHMHPRFGILAGWALLIAYVFTASSTVAAFANYADAILLDCFGVHAYPALSMLLAVASATWLAWRDVQLSARLMLGLEAASVALISAIALRTVIQHGWRPDMAQFALRGVSPEKLRQGLVLAIFTLVGFESATSLGSEARNPLTAIPRAVKWSVILAGLFFFVCAYAEVLAFRGEAQGLDKSLEPLHVLARKAGFPPLAGTLTDFGAAICFFSAVLACITAAARVLFQMGRNGALHSLLGHAHRSNGTPHRAVLLGSLAALTPAEITELRGMGLFDIFGVYGTVATFGFITVYILVCAAAPLYLRTLGKLTLSAGLISMLAFLAMGAALLGSLYPVPPAPYSFLPYIYVALLLSGFTWSTVTLARSPLQMRASSGG
jgi:amino acid transporter